MNLPSGRIKPSTGSKPSSPMRQPRAEQPQRGFWGALVSYMGIEGDTGDLINEGKRYQFRQSKPELPKQDNESEWITLKENSIVAGVVLSLWDNISGPRVWFGPTVPHDFLKQIAPFTLNGEMMERKDGKHANAMEHKTLFLSEYFSSSLIFRKHMEKYFTSHTIVHDRTAFFAYLTPAGMAKIATVYKMAASIGTPDVALSCISSALNSSLRSIAGLFNSTFTPTPFQDTFFGYASLSDIFKDEAVVFNRINSKQQQPQNQTEKQQHLEFKLFLIQVITSHFQTGCTLILGPNTESVSQWLSTLSLFLLPSQLPLAKTKLGMTLRDFVPDLVLQGIVTDQKIKDDVVIKSTSPTTIIDLHQHTVKQTPPYNEYMVIRKDYQERLAKVPTNSPLWGATEKLYRDVEPSEIIGEIINKVFKLPAYPTYVREGFISQSLSLLVRKSVILIKYMTAIKEEFRRRMSQQEHTHSPVGNTPITPRKKGQPGSTSNSTTTSAKLEEKRSGDLEKSGVFGEIEGGMGREAGGPGKEGEQDPSGDITFNSNDYQTFRRHVKVGLDFLLLLGIAEKILPGSYVDMTGNPAWIEEKLIELFEQF